MILLNQLTTALLFLLLPSVPLPVLPPESVLLLTPSLLPVPLYLTNVPL